MSTLLHKTGGGSCFPTLVQFEVERRKPKELVCVLINHFQSCSTVRKWVMHARRWLNYHKLSNTDMIRRECTDPGSKEICGCGVSLGQSDSRGNMCRQLVQSYQCTAAHRAMPRTHPRLQRREGRQRVDWVCQAHVLPFLKNHIWQTTPNRFCYQSINSWLDLAQEGMHRCNQWHERCLESI